MPYDAATDKPRPIGLVMQGGGALGAYEWGAVTRLCEAGFCPVAVTGVSIGAINAAAIAGARDGDIVASLDRLWRTIMIRPSWYVPEMFASQMYGLSLAMFGNPSFWVPRTDWLTFRSWTCFSDVRPMRRTLATICDFDRINDAENMRFAVTATNVRTGDSVRFANKTDRTGRLRKERITPDHILASGALPPGFPMADIDGEKYWDGGLFDNTPLRPMMDLLDEREIASLPIVVIDLFPEEGANQPIPNTMADLMNRMVELSFENRFWDDYGGPSELAKYAEMIWALDRDLPADSEVRRNRDYARHFDRLKELRCLRNLQVIPNTAEPMTGGIDFSERGVLARRERGARAVDEYLKAGGLTDAHHQTAAW